MPQLTLYHAAPSRASVVHWMLEELGEPYDTHILNLKAGDHRKPEYLAINPMGKVPAIKHGDVVITEVSAICTYLADAFPNAGLAVPIGDPRRGPYLKWLFFQPSCLEPAVIDRAFPRKEAAPASALGYGDYERVMDVLAQATGAASPYLLGEQFTAADVVIGSGLRWGMMFKLIPERPEFVAYVGRLSQRPALKRATEKDTRLQKEQEGSRPHQPAPPSLRCTRSSKRATLTTTRWCAPSPIGSRSSRASTRNEMVRPSTAVTSALAVTRRPTGVAAKWRTSR